MDIKPVISMVMPAYNVEKWVGPAIISLLNQTFTEFELIVVDDGSTDNTLNVLKEIEKKDSRVRVYFNGDNRGLVYTLNKALVFARGDYVARMDADDIAMPNRLEKQMRFLNDHPDYSLVGSQMVSIDEQGREYAKSSCPVEYDIARRALHYSSPVPHIWLCKKSVYTDLGGYRDVAPAEDYDFLLRMESLGYKYGNHPDVLMRIRSRYGNTASVAGLRQRKAHNYVYALYKKRFSRKSGNDRLNLEDFNNYLKSSRLLEYLHRCSTSWLVRSVRAKGGRKVLCIFIAGALSPYNAQYIWRRILFRTVLWRF